jgi:hypothetical protein
MVRIPALADDETRRTRRARLGRAGLDSLMRDARYWDADHPEHEALVDLMRGGFDLVFGTPPVVPSAPGGGRRSSGTVFDESFDRLVADENGLGDLPTHEREALGRSVILDALRKMGHGLPAGFEEVERDDPLGPRRIPARGESATEPPMRTKERREGEQPPPNQPRGTEVAQEGGAGRLVGTGPRAPIPVPDYRSKVFAGPRRDEWTAMNEAARQATGDSPTRTRVFMEIFAAEGGLKRNSDSTAFGGILKGTLPDIKKREPSLKDVQTTDELDTPEKMATAYRGYLKFVMNKYGGSETLDTLKEPETAATVADTLFMHGTKGGAHSARPATENGTTATARAGRYVPQLADTGRGYGP